MPSIGKLKEHLISLFRTIGLRYIFQLRLRLSPLRSHKWCHNIPDTVTDTCNCNQGIDDTDHFLFSCPFFETQRALLITTVIGIAQRNNLNDFRNQSINQSINQSTNQSIKSIPSLFIWSSFDKSF